MSLCVVSMTYIFRFFDSFVASDAFCAAVPHPVVFHALLHIAHSNTTNKKVLCVAIATVQS